MLKWNEDENGQVTINANADVFIIPNPGVRIKNILFDQEEKMKAMTELCELNGTDFDPEKDYMVQCWFVSKEDLGCSNCIDHICKATDNNGDVWVGHFTNHKTPAKLLDGNEGDVIKLKLPIELAKREVNKPVDGCETIRAMIDLNLRLCQTEYRYAHFGNFEDVLKSVCL